MHGSCVQMNLQTLIERLEGARRGIEAADGQCAVLNKQTLALQDEIVAIAGATEQLERSSEAMRVRAIDAAWKLRTGLQSLRDAQVKALQRSLCLNCQV